MDKKSIFEVLSFLIDLWTHFNTLTNKSLSSTTIEEYTGPVNLITNQIKSCKLPVYFTGLQSLV